MQEAGPHLNIKTIFPRYGDFHVKDKTVVGPSYLKHGDPYTGKTTSLYWDGPLVSHTWISNCDPKYSVGCHYFSIYAISASCANVLIIRFWWNCMMYLSLFFKYHCTGTHCAPHHHDGLMSWELSWYKITSYHYKDFHYNEDGLSIFVSLKFESHTWKDSLYIEIEPS